MPNGLCVFPMALPTTEGLLILDIMVKSNSLESCIVASHMCEVSLRRQSLWWLWLSSWKQPLLVSAVTHHRPYIVFWSTFPPLMLVSFKARPTKKQFISVPADLYFPITNSIINTFLLACSSVQINSITTKPLYFLKHWLHLQLLLIYTNHSFCFVKLFNFNTTSLWVVNTTVWLHKKLLLIHTSAEF